MKHLFYLVALWSTLGGLSTQPAGAADIPSTGTYSNQAVAELLKASQQVSGTLVRQGFIPPESFTTPIVRLEGQSIRPGGHVQGTRCDYWFRNGALIALHRTELFMDKGPASPILSHLTNNDLALTPQAAPARALGLLSSLSFDTNAVGRTCFIRTHDDLLTASPVSDGGPDFPQELHFFGELISRKKIRISVAFTPKNPAALTNRWEQSDMQIEFLATTGELLGARLAGPGVCSELGFRTPDLLPPIEAPDFTPPIYFSALHPLAAPPAGITQTQAIQLLHQTWAELQQKLGTNRPQCYLLCDNLNQSEILAREFSALAHGLPWAGVSHFWSNNLPFETHLMQRLACNQRGLGILAVCGKAKTCLELIRNVRDIPISKSEDKADVARLAQQRAALAPQVQTLLASNSSAPDHALVFLQATPDLASRLLGAEFRAQSHGGAQVFEAFNAGSGISAGAGVAYFNGTTLSNAIVVVHLSGSLPLQLDPANILHTRPDRRLISSEVSRPLTDFASSFGPHPMQELFDRLGAELIDLIRHAERIEVFRIKPNVSRSGGDRRTDIEGHPVLARRTLRKPQDANQLAAALLNENNCLGAMLSCPFEPRSALRVWRGTESATLLVNFESNELEIRYYGAAGKLQREVSFNFEKNHPALAKLVQRALPTRTASGKAPSRSPQSQSSPQQHHD